MSAIVYEDPQGRIQRFNDPTAGMGLQSTRDPNLEVTRYLFLAGQLLDPVRVKQVEHIREAGGGEEIETNCFRRTTHGFLPRAHLTPLETWAKPYPPELIGDGADTVIIVGDEPPASRGGVSNRPGFFMGKNLRHVKFYPGEEIKTIFSANEGKGIVEVPSLKGMKWWEDEEQAISEGRAPRIPGIAQRLNRDFFPTPPAIELRALEEMIARGSEKSAIHSDIAGEMYPSCVQFRVWAETRLSVEHGMLRERKSHHYVHFYSPVARELLKQLELQPQDRILENNAEEYKDLIKAALSQNGGSVTPEMIAQIATAVTQSILTAQQAAKSEEKAEEKTAAQKRAETIARKKAEENASQTDNSGGEG